MEISTNIPPKILHPTQMFVFMNDLLADEERRTSAESNTRN